MQDLLVTIPSVWRSLKGTMPREKSSQQPDCRGSCYCWTFWGQIPPIVQWPASVLPHLKCQRGDVSCGASQVRTPADTFYQYHLPFSVKVRSLVLSASFSTQVIDTWKCCSAKISMIATFKQYV